MKKADRLRARADAQAFEGVVDLTMETRERRVDALLVGELARMSEASALSVIRRADEARGVVR